MVEISLAFNFPIFPKINSLSMVASLVCFYEDKARANLSFGKIGEGEWYEDNITFWHYKVLSHRSVCKDLPHLQEPYSCLFDQIVLLCLLQFVCLRFVAKYNQQNLRPGQFYLPVTFEVFQLFFV